MGTKWTLVAAFAAVGVLPVAVATPARAANRGHTLAKNETMVRGDYLTVNFINGQAVATVYDADGRRAFNFWKC